MEAYWIPLNACVFAKCEKPIVREKNGEARLFVVRTLGHVCLCKSHHKLWKKGLEKSEKEKNL